MLTFLGIVLIALAALAGYLLGASASRRHAEQAAAPASPTPAAARPESTLPPAGLAASGARAAAPAAGRSAAIDPFGEEKARLVRSRDAEAALLRRDLVARGATLARLEELARERERLFRELANTRAEAARYRQLIVDIENNAPPPILGPAGPDDLKLIVGIGPVLERMLHNLGVTTFRQIARWTERDVAEFDARLPEFPGRIARDQWVTQARALHQSKYGERP